VDVDHEDHEVDVDHEDHEVDVDHTEANNIQNNITKTTKSNFFIKFSYIIIKNNQKYLFAEIGTAPTTTVVATNTYKEIYNSDGITITEYWQNKTITNELNGYTITDGEEYFVVPFDDINIIQ
jgi:regulation of enolase protein 1 (concanavalin A-like superfamily)